MLFRSDRDSRLDQQDPRADEPTFSSHTGPKGRRFFESECLKGNLLKRSHGLCREVLRFSVPRFKADRALNWLPSERLAGFSPPYDSKKNLWKLSPIGEHFVFAELGNINMPFRTNMLFHKILRLIRRSSTAHWNRAKCGATYRALCFSF